MIVKKCKICGCNDIKNFIKKGKGLTARCKDCINRRVKELYKGNGADRRKQIYEAVKTRRKKLREELNKIKDVPCKDCGIKYNTWQMDFDHLSDKLESVCRIVSLGWSLKRIKEEIGKCDIVCANCHRNRTQARNSTVE
jgi:hypothetical protein